MLIHDSSSSSSSSSSNDKTDRFCLLEQGDYDEQWWALLEAELLDVEQKLGMIKDGRRRCPASSVAERTNRKISSLSSRSISSSSSSSSTCPRRCRKRTTTSLLLDRLRRSSCKSSKAAVVVSPVPSSRVSHQKTESIAYGPMTRGEQLLQQQPYISLSSLSSMIDIPSKSTTTPATVDAPAAFALGPDRCTTAITANAITFLTQPVCPRDVLFKVLTFAGPQAAQALSRTNKYFHRVVTHDDDTWRVLCHEFGKWQPDQQGSEPASWKEYYRLHPCVPVDYATIEGALKVLTQQTSSWRDPPAKSSKSNALHTSLHILVRPGHYLIPRTIQIEAGRPDLQICIETMLPCQSNTSLRCATLVSACSLIPMQNSKPLQKDDRRNEPLIRVVRGELVLKNIALFHHSPGIDIWNGNAALQLSPNLSTASERKSITTTMQASARLEHCHVTSGSGRGIVVEAGSSLSLNDSCVTECAATGIAVHGGNDSAVFRPPAQATLAQSDIVRNGVGYHISSFHIDQQHPFRHISRAGGVSRGRSGISVEQAIVAVQNCSISHNAGAGISVISNDFDLTIDQSTIVGNLSTPVELPFENRAKVPNLRVDPTSHLSMEGWVTARSSLLERFE